MESIERWLAVPGYEGLYEVSDAGRVRSLSRPRHPGRILKPTKTRDGYYWRVDLSRDGSQRTRLVHQLVLEAFVGPHPQGTEVCHGPGRSMDNRLTNLSYGTHSENNRDKARDGTVMASAGLRSERGSGAKLTWEQVADIRQRGYLRTRRVCTALGAEFGVSRHTIYEVLIGRTWKTPPATKAA